MQKIDRAIAELELLLDLPLEDPDYQAYLQSALSFMKEARKEERKQKIRRERRRAHRGALRAAERDIRRAAEWEARKALFRELAIASPERARSGLSFCPGFRAPGKIAGLEFCIAENARKWRKMHENGSGMPFLHCRK